MASEVLKDGLKEGNQWPLVRAQFALSPGKDTVTISKDKCDVA